MKKADAKEKKQYINVQLSGEDQLNMDTSVGLQLTARERTLQAQSIKNRQNRNFSKSKLNTCTTTGTISDVSTNVASQMNRVHKNNSMGANFAELGAGMISDTPQSKHSIDFRTAYKTDRTRPNSLLKNKTIEN